MTVRPLAEVIVKLKHMCQRVTLDCGFRRSRPGIPRWCRPVFRHDVARVRRLAGG